jgi:CheY-like chemotaxis protein
LAEGYRDSLQSAIVTCGLTGFDLVLIDKQKPEMGGRQATAAIGQDEKSSRLHNQIVA